MNLNLKRLLIVDDSDFDRQILSKALAKKFNFKVFEAKNGEECLEFLEKNEVDLVIMDILMPGALGTEVLLKIREKFNPIDLPIIMITAQEDDVTAMVQCLQLGANDFIKKPLNFDIALSRLTTLLKLSDLSKEISKIHEMSAINAMISTYHHEINNPLAIAIGCMIPIMFSMTSY
ncbi:MAG: response regulator [Silvanigrellaceae bacterium]|nr:response regulator [Silvanigrellaceae bacterium]